MTPIFQAPPHQDIAPHSYVIIKTTAHCRCGSFHEYSQVFGKTHVRSRTGHTYVPNLRPVRDPTEIVWNLPITVESRPIERLPFCHECFDTVSLSHLPKPAAPTKEQIAVKLAAMGIVKHEVKRTRHWRDGTERTEDVGITEKAARPTRKFTIDDL